MSLKLEIYDGTKTYMFPNGELATPEIFEAKYPAIKVFSHMLEINGNVCEAVQEFEAMKNFYSQKYSLDFTNKSNDEILTMMENALNTALTTTDTTPTTEERIASALEYQNVLLTPDATMTA